VSLTLESALRLADQPVERVVPLCLALGRLLHGKSSLYSQVPIHKLLDTLQLVQNLVVAITPLARELGGCSSLPPQKNIIRHTVPVPLRTL
jgi:hypothetical protein